MANEKPVDWITHQWLLSGSFDSSYSCAVGHWAGDPTHGALRFDGIDIDKNESFDFAYLVYKYGSVGGSGQWKFKCYGIDEDDTAPFGYPFGRTKTTAYETIDEGQPTSGGTKTINVKSIVEEIRARSGWSRNNAMGFILEDNGSDTGVYAFCSTYQSYLVYRIQAPSNMKPTPKTVTAPSLPAVDNFGIKISKPGVSVFTADSTEEYFSTRKKQFKVLDEGQEVATSAGPGGNIVIPHGLDYIPLVTMYKKEDGKWYRMPLANFASFDNGFFYVDDTNLTIYPAYTGETFYYYIFADQASA